LKCVETGQPLAITDQLVYKYIHDRPQESKYKD
jgi:hypothetical protein